MSQSFRSHLSHYLLLLSIHDHLCLAKRSSMGEGSCLGSISTLQQQRGWMSVPVISEWNQPQNFLIGSQSHMVRVVQSIINAVWSSTLDDKLLSPRQAITLHCFWHTASSRLSELHTAGKALTDSFRRVDWNSLNQHRQLQCREKRRKRVYIS